MHKSCTTQCNFRNDIIITWAYSHTTQLFERQKVNDERVIMPLDDCSVLQAP